MRENKTKQTDCYDCVYRTFVFEKSTDEKVMISTSAMSLFQSKF